jgi:hypothetical protein
MVGELSRMAVSLVVVGFSRPMASVLPLAARCTRSSGSGTQGGHPSSDCAWGSRIRSWQCLGRSPSAAAALGEAKSGYGSAWRSRIQWGCAVARLGGSTDPGSGVWMGSLGLSIGFLFFGSFSLIY